ncbi:glycosyl transferase family 1, partial [Chromobacterium violaceum]
GVNGHLVGFFDREALVARVRSALREDVPEMRRHARRTAERYSVEQGLDAYRNLLGIDASGAADGVARQESDAWLRQ